MSNLLDLWLDWAVAVGLVLSFAGFAILFGAGINSGGGSDWWPKFKRVARWAPLFAVPGFILFMGSLSVRAWYKDHECGPRKVCSVEVGR